MLKFVLLVLAVLAVASAQYIASPYYRTGVVSYGAYPYATGYAAGYPAAVPYAYHGLGYGYTGAYYG